jgi:nitrogen fixation protein FixH
MKKNPWPVAIIGYFIVFIGVMATWIAFAVRNDDELVRADYYEHELKFQSEIDRASRGLAARIKLDYHSTSHSLLVALPREASAGSIFFYRPSDSKLDREISLTLTDGAQTLDTRNLQPGLWKVRLTWTADGVEFRHDQALVL